MTVANTRVTQVLLKRGNTVRSNQFTGALSELTHNTDDNSLRIHDGQTQGGWPIATGAQIDAINSTLANIGVVGTPYSNANVTAYLPTDANIHAIWSNIKAVDGNLIAFSNYANVHFGTSSYGNANVAAYLTTAHYATQSYVNDAVANVTVHPGGSDTQIQFNDGNVFAGHPNFTFDKNTNTLRTPDNLIVDNIYSVDSTTVHVHDNLETFGSFTAVGMYLADGGSLIHLDGNIVDLNSVGNLQLEADGKTWVFTTGGNIVFPDDTKQTTAYPGPQDLSGYALLNSPTFIGNVGISGNLAVLGNVTYYNSNNVVLNNNIIYLAENNTDNLVDIGLVGSFTDQTVYQHTGLVRQAISNTWKLVSNIASEPGLTVDFTDAVYDTLQLGNILVNGVVNTTTIQNGSSSVITLPGSGSLDVVNNTGPVNIYTDTGTNYLWQFATDGQLTSPQGGRIGDTYSDGAGIGLSAGSGSGDYAIINSHSGAQYVETNETAVYIGTNWPDTNTTWTFNKDGSLAFPDSTAQTTAWLGNVDAVAAHINFSASAVGHNPGNGTITFADGSIQNTAFQITTSTNQPAYNGLWYNTDDGRTYLKYNDAWVDANPTVAPAPSYYLGNLTVDGEVINFTNGNLTIDDTGTLLVNGSVISAGGAVDHVVIRDSNEITLDGGANVWAGTLNGTAITAGVKTVDTVHPAIFTFSADGSNTMSVQLDGTLVVGDTLPSNYGGITSSNPGWIVASGGIKLGGGIDTLGPIQFSATDLGGPGSSGSRINLWATSEYAIGIDSGATWMSSGGNIQLFTGIDSGMQTFIFDLYGNITLPTNTASINYANGTSILDGISVGPLSINDLTDVDTASSPPTTGQVLKWNGTNWVPGLDATTGGGGTDADTLDGQHGDYYLNYNNFSNVPNLSAYATVSSLNAFEANVGSFYTYANIHYGTSSYGDSNVASYLSSHNIAPQIQSDYTETNTGNVAYIKNKPDLSVYATNTALATLDANIGAYHTWANTQVSTLFANAASQATWLGNLQSNVNTINANIGAYETWANATFATSSSLSGYATTTQFNTLNTNVSGFETWANLNYLTASTTVTVNTANVAYYPNVTATTANTTHYVELASSASGNLQTFTSANLTYQPSTGNLTASGNLVTGGDLYAAGGRLRTTATTANVFNTTATTVYLAGGASIGTFIGNTAGVTQLYGNVQGSTNGFAIGYRDIPQVSFTGNTTISLADAGKHYYSTSASNFTLTVANNASVAFNIGAAINIINQGTGTITIAPAAGVTMYLAGNATSGSRTLTSYGMATIQKVAADTWFAVGAGLS